MCLLQKQAATVDLARAIRPQSPSFAIQPQWEAIFEGPQSRVWRSSNKPSPDNTSACGPGMPYCEDATL